MRYSISTLSFLASLPLSLAAPAALPATTPAPIPGDAGILSPTEWQKLEVLVDRPFHFEADPLRPFANIDNSNGKRASAANKARSLLSHRSINVDANACAADSEIDRARLISDELKSVKQVLQQAASLPETHPVWGNLTYAGNVVSDDPNPLQRTKDLFAAALAVIDDPASPEKLTFTCESDPKICAQVPGVDGTSYSVTSYFDATSGTVKFCDAFFALPPHDATNCEADQSVTSYATRTGTILHELFHAIGSAAKATQEYVFTLHPLSLPLPSKKASNLPFSTGYYIRQKRNIPTC